MPQRKNTGERDAVERLVVKRETLSISARDQANVRAGVEQSQTHLGEEKRFPTQIEPEDNAEVGRKILQKTAQATSQVQERSSFGDL